MFVILFNQKGRLRRSDVEMGCRFELNEYRVYEHTPTSFPKLEEVEYEYFDELTCEEGQALVYESCCYIYGQYLIEYCRYVCVEGKFLKGVTLKDWYFDNFPRNSEEMKRWTDQLCLENINIKVKIGKEQSKPKKLVEGLNSVGKFIKRIIRIGQY